MNQLRGIDVRMSVRVALLAVGLALAMLVCTGCSQIASLQPPASDSASSSAAESKPASSSPAPSSVPRSSEAQSSNAHASSTVENAVSPASSMPQDEAADGLLYVYFLDVGQGDCAIVTCNGHNMLIDGGPPAASSKVFATIRSLGIEHFDCIVATHPDADHIGSIPAALSAASCNTCYSPVADADTATFETMRTYLEKNARAITVADIPSGFELGAAQVRLIGPVRSFEADNDNSIVCRIEYGQTAFVFMGDAEHEAEASLIDSGEALEADVIKIGHHGSSKSTSERLLDAVNPGAAVVSVGTGNDYGHPAQSVLDRLERRGIEVLRTDLDGEVIAVSDGQAVSVATTKQALGMRSVQAPSSNSEAEGASSAPSDASTEGEGAGLDAAAPESQNQAMEQAGALAAAQQQREGEAPYIGNAKSGKFHHAWCSSVDDMSERNKVFFLDRDEAIDSGYQPCKRCTP